MEWDIDELRREFKAAPDNEALRSKLVLALMRAGLDSEATALIKDRFHCPILWDSHEGRDHSRARHCETCNKTVHFVATESELIKRAERNECVVAPAHLVEQYCGDLGRNQGEALRDASKGPHCLSGQSSAQYTLDELDHFPHRIRGWSGAWPFTPMILKSESQQSPALSKLVLAATVPPEEDVAKALLKVSGFQSIAVVYVSKLDRKRLQRERRDLYPPENFRGRVSLSIV